MKRPWLYYISPFVLVALASVIPLVEGLTEMNKHESYGVIEFLVFAIVILILLGTDYFIKTVARGKILYIWIIESVIIALIYFLLIYGGNFRLSGC